MRTITQGTKAAAPRAGAAAAVPGGRLLSNGRYTVLLTHAGTGVSSCGGLALTRWGADRVEDRSGLAIYVRDFTRGTVATIGLEPAGRDAERYVSDWEPGRFTLIRGADGLEVRLDVCVVPELDAELRRVTLVNHGAETRRIELTTAAEIVLHHPAADAGHPAFSKLFVQTEFVAECRALLARRRPRGNDESFPWLVHAALTVDEVACESDRVRFLGRGRSWARPAALDPGAELSGTTGNVLDPIASLRVVVELLPGASVERTFLLGCAGARESALALANALSVPGAVAAAFARAGEQAIDALREAGVAPARAAGLQAVATAMLYGHPSLRPNPERLLRGSQIAADPGSLGLSPDCSLVLMHPRSDNDSGRAALATARRYWAALGVPVDVVLLHEGAAPDMLEKGFRPLALADLGEVGLATLASAARLVLDDRDLGAVADALLEAEDSSAIVPGRVAAAGIAVNETAPAPTVELRHFNGHGGFRADGSEYVVRMPWRAGRGLELPPVPWVNVIANPDFGFFVSETGAGTTWNANSREHRLTPWSNDPVLDPHGEAYYLRDEDNGEWWSPLAGPAPQAAAHEMRHGFGYSVAHHDADGLEQEVTLFALVDAPLKVARVRVTNHGPRVRGLSFWSYQRLVLGVTPLDSARYVETFHDEERGLLLATNPAAGEFAGLVAVAATVAPAGAHDRQVTCDREAFLGPGGSPAHPHALAAGGALDGRAGAGLDPCFVEKCLVEIAPGASVECTFLFGEFADAELARMAVARLRESGAVERALAEAQAFWREFVGGVRIETPDPALDLMVNGWLAYQTLSCRIWGRTAFYQSGGAFGFRDQLQDAASLLHLQPALARHQLLLHAAHQFVEGDVLHWWHPPLGKGIRTRFADDLLWLPLLTAYYVDATGDWGVLDERVRFLAAEPLAPGEDERFVFPRDSGTEADLYEHCCRAIDRSLARGAHGLPLFGTGDWNDGMNRVGREGRGESVWMGFFLCTILGDFEPLCERRGDHERAARYMRFRDQLRVAVNDAGWDGEWYRRAFYDNGEPMGSKLSDECRIDGLVQAWAVLSKAAPPERAQLAMEAVERKLVSEEDGLIRLLTPPFQHTANDPGYIKGYVPGVRENGGQYTHAALWVVRAFAELGRHDRAAHLLGMLSPVRHTSDPKRLAVYRSEPYVVVADICGEPPHVGRGGWTWYTGSSGWMLRVAIESVLGIRLVRGEGLSIRPCTPGEWRKYCVWYRPPGGRGTYAITFHCPEGRPGAVTSATLDGQLLAVQQGAAWVPFLGDDGDHEVEIRLGADAPA